MTARVSIDNAITRITTDTVISRDELSWMGELAEVRQKPQDAVTKLTAVSGQMTGRAADAFEGFKAAVASGAQNPADVLAHARGDAPKMPSWMPASFDWQKAATGAVAMISAQGEPAALIGPGNAERVVFTDVDLTLLKTDTPTLLKHKTTGAYLHDPGTGKLLLVHDLKPEIAALKAKYPTFPFDDYVPDFREFGSVAELLRTSVIPEDVRLLKKSDADKKSRDFVITARSDDIMIDALDLLLTHKGIDINGVFCVNGPAANKELQLTAPPNPNAAPGTPPDYTLKSNQRKAVTMAAILLAYGGEKSVKHVKFLDDGDDNLQAAMDLLPKMFPGIKFEFYDVEHTGNHKFKQRLVARTGAGGELFGKDGKPWSIDGLKTYTDNDLPLPVDPRLYPHLIV